MTVFVYAYLPSASQEFMALADIAALPGKLNGANSRVAIMKYHGVRYLCRYIMLFEKSLSF